MRYIGGRGIYLEMMQILEETKKAKIEILEGVNSVYLKNRSRNKIIIAR